MQTPLTGLSALAVLLCLNPCHADSEGLYIPPVRSGSQEVVKLNSDTTYKHGDKAIKTKMSPNSNFETTFTCTESQGLQLTPTSDGKYVGCCTHDQILVGSEDTEFLCCWQHHILSGSKDVGFSCCPEGQKFDGKVCQAPPDPPKPDPPHPNPNPPHPDPPNPNPPKPDPAKCENGKALVDGKCACPAGTKEGADGICHTLPCSSDISYGKCYMFKFFNGEYLGAQSDTYYYAKPPSIDNGRGVFTFCPNENCTGTGPIGANDTFFIKDLRGAPRTGAYANWFLNNYANGNHIAKTNQISVYGNFSISKYPECGKYCLGGGGGGGLYYACPSVTPAMTFWPQDPGVCIPIELFEVPCDFHDEKSNHAWGAGCDPAKRVAGPPTPPHMEL